MRMPILLLFFFVSSICTSATNFKVSDQTTNSGTSVTIGGKKFDLYQGKIKVRDNLAKIVKETLGKDILGKVSIINIVPSVDTPVCENQTHILGETSLLNKKIARISISRDLPMAQKRFAKAAKLENIEYLSDFKYAKFGKKTGLLIKEKELLARAVIVTNHKGEIVHLQVVPEVAHLPNMDKAIKIANQLLEKN